MNGVQHYGDSLLHTLPSTLTSHPLGNMFSKRQGTSLLPHHPHCHCHSRHSQSPSGHGVMPNSINHSCLAPIQTSSSNHSIEGVGFISPLMKYIENMSWSGPSNPQHNIYQGCNAVCMPQIQTDSECTQEQYSIQEARSNQQRIVHNSDTLMDQALNSVYEKLLNGSILISHKFPQTSDFLEFLRMLRQDLKKIQNISRVTTKEYLKLGWIEKEQYIHEVLSRIYNKHPQQSIIPPYGRSTCIYGHPSNAVNPNYWIPMASTHRDRGDMLTESDVSDIKNRMAASKSLEERASKKSKKKNRQSGHSSKPTKHYSRQSKNEKQKKSRSKRKNEPRTSHTSISNGAKTPLKYEDYQKQNSMSPSTSEDGASALTESAESTSITKTPSIKSILRSSSTGDRISKTSKERKSKSKSKSGNRKTKATARSSKSKNARKSNTFDGIKQKASMEGKKSKSATGGDRKTKAPAAGDRKSKAPATVDRKSKSPSATDQNSSTNATRLQHFSASKKSLKGGGISEPVLNDDGWALMSQSRQKPTISLVTNNTNDHQQCLNNEIIKTNEDGTEGWVLLGQLRKRGNNYPSRSNRSTHNTYQQRESHRQVRPGSSYQYTAYGYKQPQRIRGGQESSGGEDQGLRISGGARRSDMYPPSQAPSDIEYEEPEYLSEESYVTGPFLTDTVRRDVKKFAQMYDDVSFSEDLSSLELPPDHPDNKKTAAATRLRNYEEEYNDESEYGDEDEEEEYFPEENKTEEPGGSDYQEYKQYARSPKRKPQGQHVRGSRPGQPGQAIRYSDRYGSRGGRQRQRPRSYYGHYPSKMRPSKYGRGHTTKYATAAPEENALCKLFTDVNCLFNPSRLCFWRSPGDGKDVAVRTKGQMSVYPWACVRFILICIFILVFFRTSCFNAGRYQTDINHQGYRHFTNFLSYMGDRGQANPSIT